MNGNIQPFRFGQIFKDSFTVLGKNFGKIVFGAFVSYGFIMTVMMIYQAMTLPNIAGALDPSMYGAGTSDTAPVSFDFMSWFVFIIVIVLLQAFLFQPYGESLVINTASRFLHGKNLPFGKANRQTGRKLGLVILTQLSRLVLYLPVFAVIGAAIAGFAVSFAANWMNPGAVLSGFGTFFGLYFLVIITLAFLNLIFMFSYNITVNEDRYAFKAVFRSAKLVLKGGFGPTLGHILLVGLIISGVFTALMLVVSIFMFFAVANVVVPFVVMWLFIIAALLFIVSYMQIFINFLYYNTRIRLEGYDFAADQNSDEEL